MTDQNGQPDCLRYWDLCSTLPIDAIVALWCDTTPSRLRELGFSTDCMDAKRQAIIDALRDGRLEYQAEPVPRSSGQGMVYGAGLEELLAKDGVRIGKEALRRWFMDLPFGDRPAFLFDESRRQESLPDAGAVAEMNTMRALAVMAWLLSANKPSLAIGERPNARRIATAIEPLAQQAFGEDIRGFASFYKKISKALDLLDGDIGAGIFGSPKK